MRVVSSKKVYFVQLHLHDTTCRFKPFLASGTQPCLICINNCLGGDACECPARMHLPGGPASTPLFQTRPLWWMYISTTALKLLGEFFIGIVLSGPFFTRGYSTSGSYFEVQSDLSYFKETFDGDLVDCRPLVDDLRLRGSYHRGFR